ncbi:putative P-loop containing nucleoside triphosphate hydrolase protein [Lyophyllum shimeji]|uniref:P-loop containing nucleoside triphosphate hydrolase protein n=1 Tax=Lyophyllum shimeji TaxID=47721 RepID=A0A9P3PQF0_LYOSH|nr:putative P-loop containing nucleoside triphosphate hydrolase protein [Lyophyllum shimeji]
MPALAVHTTTTTTTNDNMNTNMPYQLDVSPRSSICSDAKLPFTPTTPAPTITPPPAAQPLQPSLRLLFSLLPRRHRLLLLLPAILSSLVAGGVAPFMTFVVGQVFAAFARYPLSASPSEEDKTRLLHDIGLQAVQLVALAVGALALSSVTSCLWIWTGERNVMEVRKRVYACVMAKEMVWFDSRTGSEGGDDQGPLGAAGLMAKFTRETDDVRAASSLALGQLLQYLTTTLTCLVLAFTRSWALTLVILSAVPALILIQAFSQATAAPLLHTERTLTAAAAAHIDRAAAAIATVKAFNAQPLELRTASRVFDALNNAGRRLSAVWGLTSALGQFTTLAMFVQGFWFGAKLVREARVGPGDVMAVFWACLIATSNLQMCIPQLIVLAKGKEAARALLEMSAEVTPPPVAAPRRRRRRMTRGRVRPRAAHDPPRGVRGRAEPPQRHFCLPRPRLRLRLCLLPFLFLLCLLYHRRTPAATTTEEPPALSNVSLFLPAAETTFIVGASGSGKSSVAALLLRLYAPQHGAVCADERDVRVLDGGWYAEGVMGVGRGWGGDVVFGGMSVVENVAVAVAGTGREVRREEVEEACRAAMLHEFVSGLPEGYDTVLSSGEGEGKGHGHGVCLSGGQRQRLALARARLRNPPVLVLDEATSALDPASRLLVFAALRAWRANKTTVVITHDLAQIGPGDFVYVMKRGRVVEQGFRADLEAAPARSENVDEGTGTGAGEFRAMLDVQLGFGGCLPAVDIGTAPSPPPEEEEEGKEEEEREEERTRPQTLLRPLTLPLGLGLGLGSWMFDAVAELANPGPVLRRDTVRARAPRVPPSLDTVSRRRPLSMDITMPERLGGRERERERDRMSLQFTPTSPVFPARSTGEGQGRYWYARERVDVDEEFEDEKEAMSRSGGVVLERRGGRGHRDRVRWENRVEERRVEKQRWTKKMSMSRRHQESAEDAPAPAHDEEIPTFWATVKAAWPTIPHKPAVLLGLLICALSGAMTPLFSFLLSRLLFEVSTGAHNAALINRFGALVLGIAGLDGVLVGLKYFVMESAALAWITTVRARAFAAVLRQDKGWFEGAAGRPVRLVQVLVKDADEARNLVAVVAGQGVVVACMLGVGLVWAMARGWELTLVGLGIAPVFAGVMAAQTVLVARCEMRNKRAREEVARAYYEAVGNVRAVRVMRPFEGVYRGRFEEAAEKALRTGVRGAFVEGCTYGVASGLIYLAEALLFYVGAVLIVKGRYTYLQMVEVLNLVVFTVTIGSQLMAFTQKIAKSVQATSDFNKLLKLSSNKPSDATGALRPIFANGNTAITFSNVQFTYPSRPDVPVLRNINLTIHPGESVAIVGASGSGKSTIAALLQRLYEPDAGCITLGGARLGDIEATHLRDHVAVVSQHPHLFDASIAENIRYGAGSDKVSDVDIRKAAKAANVHQFVMGLPHGYDTLVGENAGLVSGGQAQRLQIARALVRPAEVLVLDECTSALDPENQRAVLDAIQRMKAEGGAGRTTVMVTHKVEVMKMCDRVVVLADGEVKEEGRFEELVRRKGVFATLAGAGEWVRE